LARSPGGASDSGTEAVNDLVEFDRRITRSFGRIDNCRLCMLLNRSGSVG
jgi:hypothetical protein